MCFEYLSACIFQIAPTDDSWSKESIDRFKEFQASGVETQIKSKDYVYGVQLVQLLECEFSDYSLDIAESFCLDGLAISLNVSIVCHVSILTFGIIRHGSTKSSIVQNTLDCK